MEREELARLTATVPLPQVHLPALPVAGLTAADVTELARSIGAPR
jgi:hypothetical protein